jgi:hypothetical protein
MVLGMHLRSGHTASCGCVSRERTVERNAKRTKHGYSRAPEYRAWESMLGRCLHPEHPAFPAYGGWNITVCPEWQGPTGFQRFLADMGPRPGPQYSLDRTDNDKGYSPGNCKWRTAAEQSRNRRTTKLDEAKAAEIRAASGPHHEIARSFGISRTHVGDIKLGKYWADVGSAA